MPKVSFFLILAISLLCLTSVSAVAASENPGVAIGEVVNLTGVANSSLPDGTLRMLHLESPVYEREVLITGPNSNVEIRFKDETILAQGPDSRISLDDYVYSTDPSASKLLFKMGTGTFRVLSGEIVKQNPEAFNLTTPLTSIGIRGTEPFAVVERNREQIGVAEMDLGHVVSVTTPRTTVTMSQPGLFTSVSPTGDLTTPTATPAELTQHVMEIAPMTSRGELGSVGSQDDLKNKVKAFKNHIAHTKGKLPTVAGKPNYHALHLITVQQTAHKNAESERDGGASNTGGDSGGGGGGDGGGGEGQ